MTSTLIKKQTKTFTADWTEDGTEMRMICTVRFDDQCGNGHNSFGITAEIYEGRQKEPSCYGCCHNEVAKHLPHLAPYLKWHLMSTDGPMHYLANASLEYLKSTIVYGALDDDTQFDLEQCLFSKLTTKSYNEEAKEHLEAWLKKRLPALLEEFKKAVESLGFAY